MANKVKRTIVFPEDERKPDFVDDNYLVSHFVPDDQTRAGFTKGTLKKVTFELHSGHKIIYEEND